MTSTAWNLQVNQQISQATLLLHLCKCQVLIELYCIMNLNVLLISTISVISKALLTILLQSYSISGLYLTVILAYINVLHFLRI